MCLTAGPPSIKQITASSTPVSIYKERIHPLEPSPGIIDLKVDGLWSVGAPAARDKSESVKHRQTDGRAAAESEQQSKQEEQERKKEKQSLGALLHLRSPILLRVISHDM